jgi:tetratricopeptide (TPR) repeat protein
MKSETQLKSEARRLESAGDYDRALALYEEALRASLRDPDAMPEPTLYLRVADLHFRLGRPNDAMEGYRGAAGLYRELGLMVNAVAVWKKVVRVYPEEPEPLRRLAELQLDMGLVAEARVSLRGYVEARTGAEAGVDEAVHDDVVEALRAFLDRDPDPGLAILLARRLAARNGRPEALQTLRDVRERATAEGRVAAELERELRALRQGKT